MLSRFAIKLIENIYIIIIISCVVKLFTITLELIIAWSNFAQCVSLDFSK